MTCLSKLRLNERQNPDGTKIFHSTFSLSTDRMQTGFAISLLLISVLMADSLTVQADEVQDYAQECFQAIGTTVPGFHCDAGTDVPGNHPTPSGTCDKPNRLNEVCDPGSRFQVLTRSDDAYVVAHCRKKGLPDGFYGDIAVIQYNRKNGATCFYQALGTLPEDVKAPSEGQSAWAWWTPGAIARSTFPCGGCHDNGPFIRSPYINGVTGPNALPGSDDFSFNSNQPYGFVGKDFATWKVFKVEVAGNECNGCHRLGVNNIMPGHGTALDFGIRATSATESSKNLPSADSPIWMPPIPVQVAFNQDHANSAKAIHDCALRLQENPLPNTDACRITEYTAHIDITSKNKDLTPHILSAPRRGV